jgi:uncharacterized coiled-coil protein SlyX
VPDRIVAFEDRELRSYDGGWADVERERETASAPAEPTRPSADRTPKPSRPRPARSAPAELERLEGEIAAVEVRIAELERTLADDWTNMDVLGAHRAARDELVTLLERWEVLFAEAQTT